MKTKKPGLKAEAPEQNISREVFVDLFQEMHISLHVHSKKRMKRQKNIAIDSEEERGGSEVDQ